MLNFNDFLNTNYQKALGQQANRIIQDFDGKHSPQDLVAKLISEFNAMTIDSLEAYHEWLTNNYDIHPKT